MTSNPNSEARTACLQFLYQCESEKLYHFSEGHFRGFVEHFDPPSRARERLRELVVGTFDNLDRIDALLGEVAVNWSLARMAATDRNVLRMATYELLEGKTPPKVVLDEAIELAKKFGGTESGAFVNGLLDRIVRTLKKD